MPKVIVDKQLAETLKTMRQERSLPARELADKWGKSPSYISKLENGVIKTIEQEELVQVLRLIVGSTEDDSFIEELFKTVSYKYTRQEIDEMLWFYNFESVYRRIPLPEEMVDDISEKMEEHCISSEQLVKFINSNAFLPDEIKNDDKYPFNIWINHKSSDNTEGTYIKMLVRLEKVNGILRHEIKKANYVTILSMVLYLFRILDFGNELVLTAEQNDLLGKKARNYLENYKIYTLARKKQLVEEAETEEQINEKLSKYDGDNRQIVGEVLDGLLFYSEFDVEIANEQISEFTKNLQWDSPFIMQIAGLPFNKLNDCSYRVKRQMLKRIREIFEEVADMPEKERRMEEYN